MGIDTEKQLNFKQQHNNVIKCLKQIKFHPTRSDFIKVQLYGTGSTYAARGSAGPLQVSNRPVFADKSAIYEGFLRRLGKSREPIYAIFRRLTNDLPHCFIVHKNKRVKDRTSISVFL